MNFEELLIATAATITPAMHNYSDGLEDDPAAHRWRAQWDTGQGGPVSGIALTAYPVIRLTPQGAWIDPYAFREWRINGRAWYLSGEKRWVSNTGGQAWAKPTRDEALHSIAIRLDRWATKLYADTVKLREAAETLRVLRPEDARWADRALRRLIGT